MKRKAATVETAKRQATVGETGKRQRRLFTVEEDHRILEVWQREKDKKTTWEMAAKAAGEIGRSVESVRDRMRKYI